MLTKTRYIPKDSRPIEHPAGLGVAYLYGDGRPCVIAYGGKRTKADWHYSFPTQEAAQKKIDEWFASLTGHETLKAQFKAERNKPHSLKVGDLIYNSWGWEQTNIDFYQVVRVSEHCVWLRKLCHETEEKGFMQGPTRPILGQFAEDEITQHHASQNEHGVHIHFKYGAGCKWSGGDLWCSWYA